MIARGLDTLLRYKWLLLLPPVLIPLIVTPIAVLTAPTYYETYTGIWIERPLYLATEGGGSTWQTPAQYQSTQLNEVLRTRSFVLDVARRTPLASLIGTRQGEERIHELLAQGVTLLPSGNLLTIRFRAPTPELAVQMPTALVEAYREKASSDRLNQASLAVSFYESRVRNAEEQLDKSSEELRRYVAANPRLTTLDPERGMASTAATRLGLPTMAVAPELGELLRQLESYQKEVDRARDLLEKTQMSIAASLEGQDMSFQVVDRARAPERAIRELRRRLVFPAAAVLIGLALSAGVLALLIAADRTVRTAGDLGNGVRVVGVVPELRFKPAGRGGPRDGTRRAIGYVAGTALPAPRGTN